MKKQSNLAKAITGDNRNYPRTDDEYDVLIFKENMMVKAHSKNMSEHGMYLTTDGLLFPKNSQVKLVFVEGNTGENIVYGKVVHRTMQGIGVAFNNTHH